MVSKRHHRCTRAVTAATVVFSAHGGVNKVHFEGVTEHKRLRPGSYTLLVTATAAGRQSPPRALQFTIAKG
jgi:hypothetical protein